MKLMQEHFKKYNIINSNADIQIDFKSSLQLRVTQFIKISLFIVANIKICLNY